MNSHTDIDLATTTKYHAQALAYYTKVLADFEAGKVNRPLGVKSKNYLMALSELLFKITKLQKFFPGSGHNDIVANIHFLMNHRDVSRIEYEANANETHYAWDFDEKVSAPVKIEKIGYEVVDKRKRYFVLLENGNIKLDSTPVAYKEFSEQEKHHHSNTQLKAIPDDWAIEVKRAIEESRKDGLYLPNHDGKVKQVQKETDHDNLPSNVISIFKK
ncbi:hypothetical protein [Colwellia sp. 12G3]|uniref:hypothetical protein n=1 Tax=Colwellia sp. 12G3 TaxID=2058299 RepID=UPI000C335D0C|nr:hypothetical protein [Colwellia sp. 12G3]PKI12764.1 hypothetical protein CXF71_18695 [Colwellia sp. 12G3]